MYAPQSTLVGHSGQIRSVVPQCIRNATRAQWDKAGGVSQMGSSDIGYRGKGERAGDYGSEALKRALISRTCGVRLSSRQMANECLAQKFYQPTEISYGQAHCWLLTAHSSPATMTSVDGDDDDDDGDGERGMGSEVGDLYVELRDPCVCRETWLDPCPPFVKLSYKTKWKMLLHKKKRKRKEKKIRRNTCTHRMLSVVRAVVLSDLNVMIKPQPGRCKWQCNQFWKSFTADPPLSLTRLIKVRALSETCTRYTYLTGLHSKTTIERNDKVFVEVKVFLWTWK